MLRDDIDSPIYPLVLKSTKYLPALEGKKWEDEGTDLGIGEVNQRLIRRAKLDVQIILRESSDSTKYELFQRLNTGGTQLSDQELRNAILVMINSAAYEWLQDLAEDSNFNQCTPLSERALDRQDNLELVTRFLVLRRLEEDKLKWTGDFNDFLTEHISSIAQNRDFEMIRESEGRAFRTTFELLSDPLGEDIFKKYDVNTGRHSGSVLMSAFELIAMGLGYNFEEYESTGHWISQEKIAELARSIWSNPQFLEKSGSGVGCRRESGRIYLLEGSCSHHDNSQPQSPN